MKRKLLALGFALTGALSAASAHANVITVLDTTYGTFDASSGSRTFVIGTGGTIADVDFKLDFGKCDDPAMIIGQNSCPSPGEEFASESYFYLVSPLGTRVDLIYTYSTTPEGAAQGSTKASGTYPNASNTGTRIQVLFDDQAGTPVGPVMTTGSFIGEELLAAFNGEDAAGTWTLYMGDSVGADPMSYFSSAIIITTVPQPGALALLGFGLLGLGAVRRRKR